MTGRTTNTVCVWYDSTDDGGWIVSLDRVDATGAAETTRTLDVCDTEADAIDKAREECQRRNLPLSRV